MIRGGTILPSVRFRRPRTIRPRTILVWKCRKCGAEYDNPPRFGGLRNQCQCGADGDALRQVRVRD